MNKALILAALAAVSVEGASHYAKKRVQGTKNHLERVYGKGLVGLFNEEGKLTHKALRASRMRPSYNSQPIFGIGTIDAEGASAWFYGLAKGMQYNGMESGFGNEVADSVQSDCFYSMFGLIDTASLMTHNFQNILADGTLQWFNVLAYDPVHMVGDLTVAYQYCGGQTQLNNLVSLASVDYAYISQSLSNQSVYLMTQLGPLKERFAASSYAAAIDPSQIPQICDDEKDTKVCEEWEDCPPPKEGDKDGKNCFDDPEFALDAMVTNMWETGTIWGEIMANMFQNTLEA